MKVTVYAVVTRIAEGMHEAAWFQSRSDAIDCAAQRDPGEHQICVGEIESDTWAGCVLAGLRGGPATRPIATVTVAEDGTATVTETVTRTLARAKA